MERVRQALILVLGVALSLFTLSEVNYQLLKPLSQLAVFAMLGLVLCYLNYPLLKKYEKVRALRALRALDFVLALGSVFCCAYLVIQEDALAGRPGDYTGMDIAVAATGFFLVLEATRRSIGWALPLLALAFLLYALFGNFLPDELFSHRGYDIPRVAAQTFLRTEGVFGTALLVMFTYVFLFVIFGAFLEASGATGFIVEFAQRVFGQKSGGAAKVSVLGSGLMGSLSGSAVANAVTTGTFTIPMMRSSGFQPHIAGGITAAAASGGALVPPVMGAGAYMMLEIVPGVTFVQIAKAALIPAALYYFSLLAIVHFYAGASGAGQQQSAAAQPERKPLSAVLMSLECFTFFGALLVLIGLLTAGFSPKRAVTFSLGLILVLTLFNKRISASRHHRLFALGLVPAVAVAVKLGWVLFFRKPVSWVNVFSDELFSWSNAGIFSMLVLLLLGVAHKAWRPLIVSALATAARNGVSLVSAAACVGIILGVVTLTGVGTELPNAIIPLAQESLFLALTAIMACSILLGMGLPSAVCYLLMATLIGPVLNKLGVPVLAAHLFIFYFGMMSMVTPPVALAAYASASIAGSKIMRTGLAAFRFALVGFTLPFMFVYRPELLLMTGDGSSLSIAKVVLAVAAAGVGILSLAAGIAGYLFSPLRLGLRLAAFASAALALFPDTGNRYQIAGVSVFDFAGLILLVGIGAVSWKQSR